MRKEFVKKGGKVQKHFLEFVFFIIIYLRRERENITALNRFSTLTCGLTWIKGSGWLFQRTAGTAKRKSICPQHLFGNGSEGQEASACPYLLVQCNERMAGNPGNIWDLYCSIKDMSLLGRAIPKYIPSRYGEKHRGLFLDSPSWVQSPWLSVALNHSHRSRARPAYTEHGLRPQAETNLRIR